MVYSILHLCEVAIEIQKTLRLRAAVSPLLNLNDSFVYPLYRHPRGIAERLAQRGSIKSVQRTGKNGINNSGDTKSGF